MYRWRKKQFQPSYLKDSTAVLSQFNWSFWVRGWNLLLGLTEFATTHYSQHAPPQFHLLVSLFLKHKGSMLGLRVKVIVPQSCLTLCDPMDCSLPVSFVRGILQARILEWVGLKKWKWKSLSCVRLLPDILLCPWNSPGQNTGVGSCSLLQGLSQFMDQTQLSHIAGRFSTIWATRETQVIYYLRFMTMGIEKIRYLNQFLEGNCVSFPLLL